MPPAAKAPTDPEALRARLNLLIEMAPRLHAAGVTSLSVDGLAATLVKPPVVAADSQPAKPAPRQHMDPMRDPSTYPAGKVPGFTRDEDRPA
jgi:hypothetical protein